MRTRRGAGRTRWVSCAVGLTLLATACGSGDGAGPAESGDATAAPEESPAPEGGAEDEFFAAANRICDRNEAKMDRAEAPGPPESWLVLGRHLERVFAGTLDRLSGLEAPPSLADDYDKWLRKLRKSGRAFRSLYRTVALRYPAVESPDDRVSRALERADRRDRTASQFVQLRLTDLYSCYSAMPFEHARRVATAACGGMLFCR